MEGSTDQISLNSEAIYSGYQSVNYAKKSMSSLFSLLSANNVDYSLIANLGFDYQSIINNLNEQYNKLTDYSSRLLKVKNILLKADPNNEYLFQQIDLQFIGMDMGDNPSETDLIAYFNTMKNVYYTAKGKDANELSDFEKAIIKNYEESGYADFDEYQDLISEISQLKAEYSEVNKQVQMGAGLGGYSVSTDSEKYNENQNRLIELTKKLDELESRSSFLEKNLKEKGLIELSGWEELKIAGSKYIDTLKDFKNNIVNGEFEEAHDNIKTLQATNAVVLEKVTSGVLKIGEYIQDGTIMLKTTGASVITLGIDAVFGTNYTDDMWESTMDYVAIDQVGNIEKVFYENTSLGKELNDESILKYNSKGAESIKNASKKVGEIAAATAITVATGGAAAPLVAAGIGFLEGTGQGGEKYFSMTDENGNYTNRSVKDIGLSYLEGIQKGAEWYISGQVGSGIYNGVKSFVNPASITREVASRATGNTFKDAVVNTIKLPDMYVDFAAATAKAGAGYITNGKVNWKDYAFELGFAVLGNFAGELLSAAGANKVLKNQNKVSDGKTMLENIDEQIARANITSKETGAASQIKIHSIEDLTDKQLEAISDKQLVCFVVDSKKQPVSFEDAFIELKRSGKIPADSPLMKEYQNEITRQIQYANYRAGSHDNFMSVRVDSLDDLTDGQLRMIGNRDLVSFQVTSKNGEIVSFEDAFIELKRSGKIPADSPLLREYGTKEDIILAKTKRLEDIASQSGMSLKEYGSQRASEGLISKETQQLADDLANKVRLKAEAVEPGITKDMELLEDSSAHLEGLDFRLKGEESISRKILSDSKVERIPLQEAAANIGDSVRYTLILDNNSYIEKMTECLDTLKSKGYTIRKFKNFWGGNIYQGVNTSIISPDGIKFELQFHTDSSFQTKEHLNHLFYEISRNDFASEEAKKLSDEIMAINQSKVFVPNGIIGFKY